MATRITNFLHDSKVTGSEVLGTSFNTADVHVHDLQATLPDFQKNKRNYRGIVEGLHVKLTSAGTPTKVTIRVCADADGDEVLVPDTEATLVAGITTAATKCCTYSIGLPLFQLLSGPGNGNLYVFAKLDAGTATMAQTVLTWRE